MDMASRWRWFARWFAPKAKLVLAFGLGAAAGIGCRYPAGWQLPDNTASMFAAVIGALATAAAVVLGVAAQRETDAERDRVRQQDLRKRVRISLMPMLSQAKRTHEPGIDRDARLRRASALIGDTKAAAQRLRKSRAFNEELDNEGLLAVTFIEIQLAIVLSIAQTMKIDLEKPQETADGTSEHDVHPDLRERINELVDDLSKLSGIDSGVWKIREA